MKAIIHQADAGPEPSTERDGALLLPPFHASSEMEGDCHPAELAHPLSILAFLAVSYTLFLTRPITFPMMLAVVFAVPLIPVVRWFAERGIPRFVTGGLFLAGLLAGVISLAIWLANPASEWLENMPHRLQELEYKLRSIPLPFAELSEASKRVGELAKSVEITDAVPVTVQPASLASTVLSTTGDLLVEAGIVVAFAFLLLAFGDRLMEQTISTLRSRTDERTLRTVCSNIEQTISRYLLTFSAINVVLGTVVGTGLWLLGMPNPALWGVMVALLNYVPILGPTVGILVVGMVAILSFDSVAYAMLAPAIYLTAVTLEANIITPTLLGRSMRLSPIAIFVAIVVWGWIWGIGGAVIAVPLLAMVKIVCDHVQHWKPIGVILSD